MGVYIDDKLAQDMVEDIQQKMFHYECNPNGEDYFCLYCKREVARGESHIKHAEDCDGVRFLKALSG